jgi:hypothetical protein
MLIFARCAATGRFHTGEFWQGQMGWGILVRAALMACAFGSLVFMSTKAEAQTVTERYELFTHKEYDQLSGEGRKALESINCFKKEAVDLLISRIESLITELINLQHNPELPAKIPEYVYVGGGLEVSTGRDIDTDDVISKEVDTLELMVKKLPTKICPPEPVKAATPPPPDTPVTPPKVTPVPVTPPVAETPKPAVKVCPKCRSIADQISDIDEKIAGWQRQDVSLRKGNVNDPGIQNALKDIASTIAGLKSKKAALEAQMTECEKKCVPTTEEKKTEGKTEHGTGGKTNEHKTTDKKKGRKKKNDTSHETIVGSPPGISIDIGIGLGGGRRKEQGNERIPRSEERGRKGGGDGFGTGGGGVFGR